MRSRTLAGEATIDEDRSGLEFAPGYTRETLGLRSGKLPGRPLPFLQRLARLARRAVPTEFRRWAKSRWQGTDYSPPPGSLRFGHLRRLRPVSRRFGGDRGKPVDRYYIERFLAGHQGDIRGRLLEVGDDRYTQMFGSGGITGSDVLHPIAGNPHATIVADLSYAPHLPSDTFDCVLLTQVLQFVKDPEAVVRTLYRILRPGGVVLATTAGISQIIRWDMERWGDYWRYTELSAAGLFAGAFPEQEVRVQTFGNVLAAIAFLQGLATEELRRDELEYHDPDYQVIIGIRAHKPIMGADDALAGREARLPV
jgi:SAM-dependent methyltransferase